MITTDIWVCLHPSSRSGRDDEKEHVLSETKRKGPPAGAEWNTANVSMYTRVTSIC